MVENIYIAILSQLLVELGIVCDSELYPTMSTGLDLEFLRVVHDNKKGKHCFPADYCT
jgi:hypothetical protein